eukprot:COSAG02_NODE_6094_length_3806_cov_1.516320_4_plen_147_part_00
MGGRDSRRQTDSISARARRSSGAHAMLLWALGLLGLLSLLLSDVEAAVEKFTEALEIIGDEVENEAGVKIKKGILLNRSAALIKIGEDEIVVDDCTEVLEMEPGNSKALFRRAMALVNLDRWQEAVSCSVCLISAAQPVPLPASRR